MNDNAKKWVAALRSGDYEQCRSVLHVKDDGYCCLGVACDLYCKEVEDISQDPANGHDDSVFYADQREFLPNVVMLWLGLNNSSGRWNDNNGAASLAAVNDEGAGFNEIANIIESKEEDLFDA